jgi:hypothetical protein
MTRVSDPTPSQTLIRDVMGWLREDSWLFRLWAALFGILIALAVLLFVDGAPVSSLTAKDVLFVGLIALGGGFGGFLMSGWFGRSGAVGSALTLVGAWLAGGLAGAFVGATFSLLKGTLIGATLGATAPFLSLASTAIWLICCAGLHFAIKALRRKRVTS